MKRLLYYFIIIVLILIQGYQIIPNDIYNNFINIAEDYIARKRYFKLKRVCNSKLNKNPDYYIAAYYKAYSMFKLGKANALKYYLEYIEANPEMPNSYKEKWLEIAVEIYKKSNSGFIKSKVNLSKNKIEIDIQDNNDEFYTKPKVLHDAENIYYLAQNGELFLIKKILKTVKKINYYKTRDFVLFDNYIVFNDSINLIKYKLNSDIHELIYTFDKDNISFLSSSPLVQQGVLKHQVSEDFLIKLINFRNNEMKELPDNCIAQSKDYIYFVMNYNNYFDVYNYNGDKLFSVNGRFISFGINESEIYFYMDDYLYFMDITDGIKKQIVYIPEFSNFNGLKAISYNRLLLYFDQYIIDYKINNNQINLTEGKLLHILKTGYMFTDNNSIYYYSLLNSSIKVIFDDMNILNKMIFPDNDSMFFIIVNGKDLVINNLR